MQLKIRFLGCVTLFGALLIGQEVGAATLQGLLVPLTAEDCSLMHFSANSSPSQMDCCEEGALSEQGQSPDNPCNQACAEACSVGWYIAISPMVSAIMPEPVIEEPDKPASFKSIDVGFVTPPPRV